MKGELRYAYSKVVSRIFWIIFWLVLLGLLIYGAYQVAATMQMRSLPTGQIQLIVPYSKYLVGEPVTFTLKNNYNSSIYLTNSCPEEPLNVYRLENGTWIRIHDTASISDCSNEQRQIEIAANGSVSGSFTPWHHLFSTPGTYRVVAYVEYYDALPYQDFQVVAKYVPAPKPVISLPSIPIIRRTVYPTQAAAQTTTTTFTEPQESGDD